MSKRDKRRRKHTGSSTGKNRRAVAPGGLYTTTVEEQEALPWRDRLGTDMHAQPGFTQVGNTPVLLCSPTHELQLVSEDGSEVRNTWAEALPLARFTRVHDMRTIHEVGVDTEWTVRLGPASRNPTDQRFFTLNCVVRGPSMSGKGIGLFYQGPVHVPPDWITEAKAQNKLIILTSARDGTENWAAAAHLNRPKNH